MSDWVATLSKAKGAQPPIAQLMKLDCKNQIAKDKNRKPAAVFTAMISQVVWFVFVSSAVVVCLSGPLAGAFTAAPLIAS